MLDLGGRNDGTRFYINDIFPLSGSSSESDPASEFEAFIMATNDYFA